MLLSDMYLGVNWGPLKTGQAVEGLQEAQKQDWMMEKFPASQLPGSGELCIDSCLGPLRWGG